jgi:glycosyltransferase involved in cell wall biosynthesis
LSFTRAQEISPKDGSGFDVHLAGAICNALPASPHPFIAHGIVDSVSDFMRSIDVIVNPMLGGTGLKIKSLEALSYGKPLVATIDAMTGIDTIHEGHRLADIGQIVRRLAALAEEPDRLDDESAISRRVFEAYRRTQLDAFLRFWSGLEQEAAARRLTSATRRKTGAL